MLHALAVIAFVGGPPELPPPSEAAERVVLHWDAPEGCPDQAAVAAAIAARHPVDPVEITAKAVIEGPEHVADIAIESAHGSTRRHLRSPACASIVDALALLVQVAADPLPTPERIASVIPGPVSPPAPRLPELEPEVVVDPAPVRPVPTPPVRPRPRARLALAAIAGGGTLPGVDLGGRLSVGIASRHVHADVGALVLAPRPASTPADVEVVVDAFAAVARLCPVVPLGRPRLELSVCAVATAGALRGRSSGAGVVGAATAFGPWVRLAAAPELAVVVHPRVRFTATLEAGAHVARAGFAIAGLGQVWSPRPWAVHGGLGVEVRLP